MLHIRVQFLGGAKQGTVEVFPTGRYDSLYCGRDPNCDIRFDPDRDVMVSRSHAVIEWQATGSRTRVQISDLLSSNGTFVNERPIKDPVTLHHGDRIRFGRGGPEIEIGLDDGTEESPGPRVVRQTQEIPKSTVAETLRRPLPKL